MMEFAAMLGSKQLAPTICYSSTSAAPECVYTATVSTVVRGVTDMQGGEHSGHPLPSLCSSHLDDRYRLVSSSLPLYPVPPSLLSVL
eukprot:superscaffoldBa00001765_g11921